MKKNNLMVFGLAYIKDGLEGQTRIFVESHFFGRYGSVVLQIQREDMIQKVSFLTFFSKLINPCCG